MKLTGDQCLCRECRLVFADEPAFAAHRKPLPEKNAPTYREYLKNPTAGCIDPAELIQLRHRRGVWETWE
jgi:hypothetical protein